ncbi:MAG: YdeI/OmpD-associated family protein [Aestuariibaculum sp.]
MKKANSVEEYIENNPHFEAELNTLRTIMLSTDLVETLKWSAPVYTINNKNVLGIGAFKHHFCIWFYNGVFLKDSKKLLVNAQEEKTKALRQMRFNSMADIDKTAILTYVKEAIENQKLGKEHKPKKNNTVDIPVELQALLGRNKNLKAKFDLLSPYKQKEYCEHIATAKREATKQSRLEKIEPMILKGIGLHDKYRDC